MTSMEEVLKNLKAMSKLERLQGMARYGMGTQRRWGVSVRDIRKLAKEIGKNHSLAIELWKTGIPEAMIIASMIDESEKVKEKQMEDWVKDINSWDVCDQVCMNLFRKTSLAWTKILDWSAREEEFVKRTAFTLIACVAWHNKDAEDEKFIDLFSVIKREATDDRNYVKKAINWALRNIGKRSLTLNKAAINTSKEIQQINSRTARWIASNAIEELESEGVQRRLRR